MSWQNAEAAAQGASDMRGQGSVGAAAQHDDAPRSSGLATRLVAVWRHDTWVKPFFARYAKVLALAVFLGLLATAFAGALMFTSGFMISVAATLPLSALALHLPSLYVRVFGVGKPVLQYFERLASHDWVLRMTSSLRYKLYATLERGAVGARRMGEALGLLAEDIEHVQNLYLRTAFPLVVAWLLYALVIVALGVFSVPVALAMALLLGVVALVLPAVSVCVNGARLERAKAAKDALYAELTDNVLGISDWMLSGRREDYLARYRRLQDAAHEAEARAARFGHARDVLAQVALGLCVLLMLAWAAAAFGEAGVGLGWIAAGAGSSSAAGMGADAAGVAGSSAVAALSAYEPHNAIAHAGNWIAAFALCLFPLFEAFSPVSSAAEGVVAHLGAVERMNALEARGGAEAAGEGSVVAGRGTNRADDRDGTRAAEKFGEGVGEEPGAGLDSGGSSEDAAEGGPFAASSLGVAVPVEFSDVTFRYQNAESDVLQGLNLSIHAGQKVAVLGRSGAGKSTLAMLLRGIEQPTAGRVLVAGRDAHAFGDDIAQVVGVIQQTPHLFSWTLRDNLALAKLDATDEQLTAAMQQVGLGELLQRLPQGLDTVVDEGGRRFSGGECHRIALARVLLANTPVVVLDEPFAGLDPATEQALLDIIFRVLADRTVIMVTHHLQGVFATDRVVFLEDGRVALDGAPEKLAATNDRFRRLLELETVS